MSRRQTIKNDSEVKMTVKEQLFQLCKGYVEDRITMAAEAIKFARESSQTETKSSAGDKYETGRAMAQLEIENNSRHLAEAKRLLQTLQMIDCTKASISAQLGSIVFTPQATYFLSISIGQVHLAGKTFLVISPASPIGQAMLGKRAGDDFLFAGKTVTIEQLA